MSQMKGLDKTPEKQLKKWRWQPSRKEFRIVIVKIIQNLGKTMEKMKEMFYQRPRRTKLVEVIEFQLSYLKSQKMML